MSGIQNSDTFLSRVFGLHSVYNQINDNYHYYDDEEEDGSRIGYGPPNRDRGNTNIMDSESDSDSDTGIEDQSDVYNQSIKMNNISSSHKPDLLAEGPSGIHHFDDIVQTTKGSNIKQPQNPASKGFAKKFDKTEPQIGAVTFELPLYHKKNSKANINPSIHTIFQKKNRNISIPPKERALYLWANITNMDEFLQDIYYYYRAKGYTNILLTRLVDLAILVFLLSLTIFLKYCINYDLFLNRNGTFLTLRDLIIKPRLPLWVNFLLFGFACYVLLRLVQLYFDLKYKLKEIRNFYKYLVNIQDDSELMTISWSVIVERLMLLKDYNGLTTSNDPHYLNDLSSKIRLNAHDIANRIMRKENYLIGLVNKNVLDFDIKLPFSGYRINTLTRTLDWNLQLCINNFVFNEHGQINSSILKEVNRNKLAAELKSRFQMSAIVNLIICPFIVTYFILLNFFKYFNEYKNNPGSILGIRQYTPLAEWKLREFNELQHFFLKRLQQSVGPANTYINQFPKGFLVSNISKLINFISGSFMAVLVICGLWLDDEEHAFWSFELTEGKSALFYISIFGTIWAVTNNATSETYISDESRGSFFYDPEASLRYVSQFTHYLPSSWNGRLHTNDVKNEFCDLYSLKIVVILMELMSLILTPFILWFKVSNASSLIVDFYREYSIHVDGLGYVCYFAMFNFEEKDKNMMFDLNKKKKNSRRFTNFKGKPKVSKLYPDDNNENDSDDQINEDAPYNSFQNEKMIKSYLYFLESYDQKSKKIPLKLDNGHNAFTQSTQLVEPTSNLSTTTQRNPNTNMSHQSLDKSMTESMYHINYKFDETDEPMNNKPGVLGMLNQFYKHTELRR